MHKRLERNASPREFLSSRLELSDSKSGGRALISWIAYVLNLVSIVLVYHGLFGLFQSLCLGQH